MGLTKSLDWTVPLVLLPKGVGFSLLPRQGWGRTGDVKSPQNQGFDHLTPKRRRQPKIQLAPGSPVKAVRPPIRARTSRGQSSHSSEASPGRGTCCAHGTLRAAPALSNPPSVPWGLPKPLPLVERCRSVGNK